MNRVTFAAGAAALLIGGAAIAHPHPEGADGEKKIEKVIIMTEHAEGKGKGGDHAKRLRTFHIERDGHALADCLGGRKLADESAGDDKKTKVVICSKGGDGVMDAERLEKALARINANENLSAEHKVRISAALREAIERSRSAR